jgi:folate-binding protein YgfZ
MSDEYRLAREKAVLFDVSDRGKIEVKGPDAAKFLHNLCTNDILSLPEGAGREAFLCTVKAKVVSPLLVYRAPESFWLDTGPGTGEKVFKHLDRHLISEQVELADRTGDFAQFHLAGPEALAVLAASASPLPELTELQHLPRSLAETVCFVRRHNSLALPGYDIVCPKNQAPAVHQALLEIGARPAGPDTWNLLRVEVGTPLYGVDIDDERFVVEVGRIPQAVSYTKGCYLGQEPIVMARDRGHVNRTLLGVKLSGTSAVAPGTKLLREGAEVGQTTSSVVSPRFGPIALAYLRRGSWDPGTVVEVQGEGRTAEVVALPFA